VERLEQHAQEHRRWVEAEIARAAAEEAAKRAAAEREARRRRRSRAAKRAAKRKAAERKAAKQKTPRPPQRSDAQRVAMTQDDIDWARKAQQDDIKKGFRSLDAAYLQFKERWSKDPDRRKQKVPGRTQFSQRIWNHAE
jgi:sRNA-binding protein